MTMNIQEREELDYDPRSDAENAFAQSRMETTLVDPEIAKALDRGMVALVHCGPAYCPSTDAILGERVVMVQEYPEREAAELQANRFNEEEECDEYYYDVRPKVKVPYPFNPRSETIVTDEPPF